MSESDSGGPSSRPPTHQAEIDFAHDSIAPSKDDAVPLGFSRKPEDEDRVLLARRLLWILLVGVVGVFVLSGLNRLPGANVDVAVTIASLVTLCATAVGFYFARK